jgi:hypothetical protein
MAKYRQANYLHRQLKVNVNESTREDEVVVPWIPPREIEMVLRDAGMSVRGLLRSHHG